MYICFVRTYCLGNVQKIPIHRIRLLRGGLDGNFVVRAVRDHLVAAGELVAKPLVAPRRDDLQVGASAAAVSSKRTWSLPLPVAPCAMASAFSFCAISTCASR